MKESSRLNPVQVGFIAWIDGMIAVPFLIDLAYSHCGRLGAISLTELWMILGGFLLPIVGGAALGVVSQYSDRLRSGRLWLITSAVLLGVFALLITLEPSISPLDLYGDCESNL